MPDYTDLFDQRGSSYDRAMQAFPAARAEEFRQLLAPLVPRSAMIIGDVPAGGGYLRAYIAEGCEWVRHEPCADFTTHAGQDQTERNGVALYPFPWKDESIDAVVSLAGIHHLEDKRRFFAEAHRVTRPQGDFVVSDVARDHPVAAFLDEFVGAYNSTGHEGLYLDEGTGEELRSAGWSIVDDRANDYHWVFPDRSAMIAFVRRLFDIGTIEDGEIGAAIDDRLGVDDLRSGQVGMRWGLRTIHARRIAK
ncbi:methyltransferase domain-containing protein [Sphingomicrobium sp. XHP0239]|uniref:class I SAM-dependent methyltransferase n=1 Tax=Sphingomicrobium maritimum TaxID=3133972 RepID=UPI0031CC4466